MEKKLRDVIFEIAGLRHKGLTDRQVTSWEKQLAPYNPEDVMVAAEAVAKAWTEGFDWPIGVLLQRLGDPGNRGAFTGFTWCLVTGTAKGDWGRFLALDDDERLLIAIEMFDAAGEKPIMHLETAELMWPGVEQAKADLMAKRKSDFAASMRGAA